MRGERPAIDHGPSEPAVAGSVSSTSVATTAFKQAVEAVRTWDAVPSDRGPAFDLTAQPEAVVRETWRPVTTSGRIGSAGVALRSGLRSCQSLVEEALTAIERDSDRLGAFVEVLSGQARADAERLDVELRRGDDRGPLHGIPVSVKDVIDVAGAMTRAGSETYGEVVSRDAGAVARLRERGAIILGKATTHEFALGVTTPQARNPHDDRRIPGGSSGGSAIAVATGMGLASLATDTRGSTRIPAALCGVVGLKPTFGAIPTDGVVPLSWTMDHIGILAATVADAAAIFDVLVESARPVASAVGCPIRRMRVAVPDAALEAAEPDVSTSIKDALDRLRSLDVKVSFCPEPNHTDLANASAMGLIVSRCEAAAYHRSRNTDRTRLWAETRDQLDAAGQVSAVDYIDSQRYRSELRERMLGLFHEYDLLAMPTTVVTAPLVERAEEYLTVLSRNSIPWSFLGFPALSIPCPGRRGLPVGLQLVTRPHAEEVLIAAGSKLSKTESR